MRRARPSDPASSPTTLRLLCACKPSERGGGRRPSLSPKRKKGLMHSASGPSRTLPGCVRTQLVGPQQLRPGTQSARHPRHPISLSPNASHYTTAQAWEQINGGQTCMVGYSNTDQASLPSLRVHYRPCAVLCPSPEGLNLLRRMASTWPLIVPPASSKRSSKFSLPIRAVRACRVGAS